MSFIMNDKFVFDTYALVEIIKGNKNYEKYLDSKIIINTFIFAELCYFLYREKYPSPEKYINKYSKHLISLEPSLISQAMEFREKNKKKKLSMTDCVSYFMARELGVNFLTGDKEFENLAGVEFVK